MAHSTTATATHVLLKYSRSYPPHRANAGTEGVDAEWQHFGNPLIRLVLDTKKSTRSELESVRLRIIWSMNGSQDAMDVDENEVIFEDLDLLSFSSLNGNRMLAQGNQPQSLPLKAVYRDAMVGIRYLHPRIVQPDSTPVYRRFQITFASAAAALEFIVAIRSVCPCKTNLAPVPNRSMTMNLPLTRVEHLASDPSSRPPDRHSSVAGTTLAPSTSLARSQVYRSSPLRVAATEGTGHTSPEPSLPAGVQIAPTSEDPALTYRPNYTPVRAPSSAPSSLTSVAQTRDPHQASHPADHLVTVAPVVQTSAPLSARTASTVVSEESSLRIPSLFGSSNFNALTSVVVSAHHEPDSMLSDSAAMPSPPPPPTILPRTYSGDIAPASITCPEPQIALPVSLAASLHEIPELCKLSRVELQEFVGQVIREEGFLQLLENLDHLWREKGYMNC